MRLLRAFVLGGLLAVGLGCAGTAELLGDLAGLDLSLKLGESAVHPDDFPVGPPAAGKKRMSAALTTTHEAVHLPEGVAIELAPGDYQTEFIAYAVPLDQVDRAVQVAVGELETHGWTEGELADAPEASQAALYVNDPAMFLVLGGGDEADGEGMLVLMRLRPAEGG